jgi:hypothetical protein
LTANVAVIGFLGKSMRRAGNREEGGGKREEGAGTREEGKGRREGASGDER